MTAISDEKSSVEHVEYDQDRLELGKGVQHHIDIHDAAAQGHVATDEKGQPLVDIDQAASARLARKIDLYVVPIVALQYLFSFIDRANIGNARLAGLEKDLGLHGYDYNILLSIFYVSYIAFEIPANLFTKWLGPGKAIPLYTFLFGVFSICTAFITNLGTGSAVRFFLGVAEAGAFPGIAYYLSRWYTKDELVFRLSLYVVCAPLAGAFGGLLASGILKIGSIGTIHSWRLIFLVEGIITAAIGILSYFVMTDRPSTARWLSDEEKELAIARIKREQIGATVVLDKMSAKRVLQGISAPPTLVISLIYLLVNITVGGVAFFTPTIISTIYPTKTTIQKQLQTVPPYIVGAFFTLFFPYLAMKFKRRGVIMMCASPMIVVGYIMYLASYDSNVRYAASFIVMGGAFAFGALCNGWAAINVANDTARASSISFVTMMGNVGGLVSTWSALPRDAPNYPILNGLNLAVGATMFCLAGGLLIWMKRDNAKRERGDYDYRMEGMTVEESAVLGNDHPGFRYQY